MRRLVRLRGLLLMTIGVALTVASGVIHGRLTHRWEKSGQFLFAEEQLKRIPHEFGEWQMLSSQALPPVVISDLQCDAYICRTYANRNTGEEVSVTIVVGPSGPIWGHSPEGCYASRDFTLLAPRRRVQIQCEDLPDQSFWATTHQSVDFGGQVFRVLYALSDGGPWSAFDSPRLHYASRPYLYKMQCVCASPTEGEQVEGLCEGFLRSFLPVVQQYLTPHARSGISSFLTGP